VIITTAVTWPPKEKKSFGPYQVLPPCEKCEDYTLQNSQDYYFALLRRLGTLAGLQKVGKLGPEIDKITWSPYFPDVRGCPNYVEEMKLFAQEVAPQIWPASVKAAEFWKFTEEIGPLVEKLAVPIQKYLYSNPLYVGFGHQNGNTDNAYFYLDGDRTMECGIFDWGSCGHMAYATQFMGAFGSCLAEVLAEYDDRLMQAFADAYNATGAPQIDAEELVLHLRLMMSVSACQMFGMCLLFLSEKHPLGRPFWKGVKAYNEDKIRADFATKFGISILYNRVVLLSLRGEVYRKSMVDWAKRIEKQNDIKSSM